MAPRAGRPCIYVLAGVNGAGKSSVLGATLLQEGGEYFNPDDAATRILLANPGMNREEANSAAWHEGKRLLEAAITAGHDFAFETTLGGQTITTLLELAISMGIEVRVAYVGLSSLELHLARVRARVAQGGHDIPEETIRNRFNSSRLNLIRLLPALTELRLWDNSAEADPGTGIGPEPLLILHCVKGAVVDPADLSHTPEWAKPIVAAAMRQRLAGNRRRLPRRGRHRIVSLGNDIYI